MKILWYLGVLESINFPSFYLQSKVKGKAGVKVHS